MVIQRPKGCGQNPAYRPAGVFFFFLRPMPPKRLKPYGNHILQAIDILPVPAGEAGLFNGNYMIAVETIC